MKRVYSLLIASAIIFSLPAQTKSVRPKQEQPGYYKERAAQIRAEVWAWDNPAFKNYTIPDELKNESSVILVSHRQIDAAANKKSGFAKQFLLNENTGKLFFTDIDRKMIKINDQTALKQYSEFSFKEESKFGPGYIISNLNTTILGVRIIKPDGSIKEINVPESTVTVSEGKKDKNAYKKLAIPELQVNDIIDFFICHILELDTYNLPEQYIPFYSIDCPALRQSCSLTLRKNLTVEYRSINGAPEFSTGTDENGNILLTAESDNIQRINDVENIRWLSPLRTLPMIRFVVLKNASKSFYTPKSARPAGVYKNVPYDKIVEDAKYYLAFNQSKLYMIRGMRKEVIKIIDNYIKEKPDLSKEELANTIFTALNFKWRANVPDYYPGSFILTLNNLFKKYEIDSSVGFVTSKYDARKDEVVTSEDLTYMIAANKATQYFFLPYRYRVPGEIPAGLQGESASTFSFQKISERNITNSSFGKVSGYWSDTVNLPESGAMENTSKMLLNVSFNPDDMQKIDIERHSVWSGSLKSDIQPQLLLYEDWDKELRRYLKIDKSYIDELNEKKSAQKQVPEVEGSFKKSREKYAETIKDEIKQYHGFAPEKVKDYSFSSLGVTVDKPQLEYDISYTMNDFVRNAGDNIILDAGKLIGEQWNPTENERKRNIDAYIPTRWTFEREIIIRIPDNYTVGDIKQLNVNFSNEYVTFDATAGIENNAIKIKTKKTYNQTFIPKEEWPEMIDIIDKTNEFYSESIILKRTNP